MFFRCLEKVFEEERNKNKEENSRGVTKLVTVEIDCDNEILGLTLYLLARTPHKKLSFPLRISPVNVTKSAVSCGFGHIYWRSP